MSFALTKVSELVLSENFKQFNNPALILQIDLNVLKMITLLIARGDTQKNATKNILSLARVCKLFHHISHSKEIKRIIIPEKLNAAVSDLAKAIIAHLNVKEDKDKQAKVKSAVNILYNVFKEFAHVSDIKGTDYKYAHKTIEISIQLRDLCKTLCPSAAEEEIWATCRAFAGKTIKDIVAPYVAQPLSKITREGLTKKIRSLGSLFAGMKMHESMNAQRYFHVFLEAKTYKAIRAAHSEEAFTSVLSDSSLSENHDLFKSLLGCDLKAYKSILNSGGSLGVLNLPIKSDPDDGFKL